MFYQERDNRKPGCYLLLLIIRYSVLILERGSAVQRTLQMDEHDGSSTESEYYEDVDYDGLEQQQPDGADEAESMPTPPGSVYRSSSTILRVVSRSSSAIDRGLAILPHCDTKASDTQARHGTRPTV